MIKNIVIRFILANIGLTVALVPVLIQSAHAERIDFYAPAPSCSENTTPVETPIGKEVNKNLLVDWSQGQTPTCGPHAAMLMINALYRHSHPNAPKDLCVVDGILKYLQCKPGTKECSINASMSIALFLIRAWAGNMIALDSFGLDGDKGNRVNIKLRDCCKDPNCPTHEQCITSACQEILSLPISEVDRAGILKARQEAITEGKFEPEFQIKNFTAASPQVSVPHYRIKSWNTLTDPKQIVSTLVNYFENYDEKTGPLLPLGIRTCPYSITPSDCVNEKGEVKAHAIAATRIVRVDCMSNGRITETFHKIWVKNSGWGRDVKNPLHLEKLADGMALVPGIVAIQPAETKVSAESLFVDHEHGLHLCDAAEEGNASLFKELLKTRIKEIDKATPVLGSTPLIIAADSGHLEIVNALIEAKANLDIPNKEGWTPLNSAATNGNIKIVEALVKAGAKLEIPTNDGFTPLAQAIFKGHVEIVDYLLRSGANLRVRGKDGRSLPDLVGQAPKYKQKLLLELLTKNGLLPELHLAAATGSLDKIKDYFDRARTVALRVNERDSFGESPLHWAARGEDSNVVEALLNGNALPDIPNLYGNTPLILATRGGHLESARKLIAAGVNLNTQDKDYWTSLNLATFKGKVEIVNALLEAKANPDIPNKSGSTPLNSAAKEGYIKIMEALVKAGAKLEIPNNDGFTPLAQAVFRGHVEAVELLLKAGASPHVRTRDGRSLADLASQAPKEKIERLIELLKQKEELSELHRAARDGDLERVQKCLDRNIASLGDQIESLSFQGRPLHLAASNGRVEVVELLLKRGAQKNALNLRGSSALITATKHIESLRALIRAKVNLDIRNNSSFNALYYAAYDGNTEIVKALIEAKANLDITDKKGWSALHIAASMGRLDSVKALVAAEAYLEIRTGNEGHTPLGLAVVNGHAETAKYLLSRKADPSVRTKDGKSLLDLIYQAPKASQDALLELFRDQGILSELHVAATKGDLNEVKRLTLSGNELMSEVHRLSREGKRDEAARMLSRANETDLFCFNETALHQAVRRGHTEVIRELVKDKSRIDVPNYWGWRPLHFATANGDTSLVGLLLEKGANPNLRTTTGSSPIYVAAEKGNPAMVKLLADRRADVNQPKAGGWTPLMAAAEHDHVDVIRELLARTAHLETVSEAGYTALAVAVFAGKIQAVQALLEAKANPAVKVKDKPLLELLASSKASAGDKEKIQKMLEAAQAGNVSRETKTPAGGE